jgi:hypothetical protein
MPTAQEKFEKERAKNKDLETKASRNARANKGIAYFISCRKDC